jgi:hypothetical protein
VRSPGCCPHTCFMRQAFAQEAVLVMEPDADVRAPGAAVTVALCGHWDHEPPCPLAPHQVGVKEHDGELRVRILLEAEPDTQAQVRQLIDPALSGAAEVPGRPHHRVAAARKPAGRGLSRRDRACRAPDPQLSTTCGRSGRSLGEERRYTNASAGPRSNQESRSARVSPGIAFPQMPGIMPSLERRREPENVRKEFQDRVRRLHR